jgi:hypothetical protein
MLTLSRFRTLAVLCGLAISLFGLQDVVRASAEPQAAVDGAAVVEPAGSGDTSAVCAKRSRLQAERVLRQAASKQRALPRARRVASRERRACERQARIAARRKSAAAATANISSFPDSLVIGIDGGYFNWNSEEIEMRAQLGAAVTRHEWDITKPVNAQDTLVYNAAAQVHTRVHALLGANELGDPNHYREWVVAFIQRYGEGGAFWAEHPELDASRYAIRTFELGNEPYYGGMTATQYAETVRPTLEAVHQLGLPAKLVLPSVIFGTDTSWMDTLYRRIPNLNSLFYGFADHPYWYGHDPAESGNDSPLERVAMLRKRMDEQGATSKPILITEYGESTANCGEECVSETVQAAHIQTMLSAVISHPEWGVKMLSFFQLHDWAANSSEREEQFGILRQNGTPKPAYAIVQGAMQQYRG